MVCPECVLICLSDGERGNGWQIGSIQQMEASASGMVLAVGRHTDRWGGVELKVSSWMPDGIMPRKKQRLQGKCTGLASWHLSPSLTLQVSLWWMRGEETVAILAAWKLEPGFVFVCAHSDVRWGRFSWTLLPFFHSLPALTAEAYLISFIPKPCPALCRVKGWVISSQKKSLEWLWAALCSCSERDRFNIHTKTSSTSLKEYKNVRNLNFQWYIPNLGKVKYSNFCLTC